MAEITKPKLVTIFGGSGFLGRYIVRRMARAGWRVRVAVRRPNEAGFLRPAGDVGQIEPILANIRDASSSRAAIQGADAVVNCVGTFDARGANYFDAIHVKAGEQIAALASEQHIRNLVHISSISANPNSPSRYAQTKAKGDARIQKAFPNAVILRPTLIFGPEDRFFNRFASICRTSPVLPLIGAKSLFQPVYVDDVAAGAEYGIQGRAKAGIYELGGPEIVSFHDLMAQMLEVIGRKRMLINIPFPIAKLIAKALDLVELASLGLLKNTTLTPDQVISLREDQIVTAHNATLEHLGVTARTAMASILETYLWRHRPAGQYYAIKASSQNLRG